jgi:hypothetical protein
VLTHLAAYAKAKGMKDTEVVASCLNQARDGIGMGVLHLAALNGNCKCNSTVAHLTATDEVLDLLLDQEGLEIDELDRMEEDTPLHKAVRFTNGLDKKEWEAGKQIVDILLDAGCDPRIRNKAKLKPGELADPRNEDMRSVLRKAEYSAAVGHDDVVDDNDGGGSGSETD